MGPSYNNYYNAQRPNLLQRCMSSQSLPNDAFHYPRHNPIFSSLDESNLENFDFETSSMRKVFSTGDLQTINLAQQQQHSHEKCNIEGTKKVRCYSAQERKERIERYRIKRSQRNFNKKIKYACRKTLADSRPRIRGRFARNEEIGESIIQSQWSLQIRGEEDEEEEDGVWSNYFLSALSTNLIP
ncbi:two-component response regulator-like APRR1 [Telopea speciosissima]|uniref:two-component response regulator-like APRR1 n=1 Tax=Telopea speciosissima TaxID=54955 RepID=UPI001CC53552|nr:two-component response regulator-like APRR1 [Telopea speciosissima]